MASNRKVARTDTESLVRQALGDLVVQVHHLTSGWTHADPDERGRRWEALKKAATAGDEALRAEADPKPGQCARMWYDVLDGLYDRCGLPLGHGGGHSAEYVVKGRGESGTS